MECTYCGEKIGFGEGKIVSDPKGNIEMFCSSKCEKNWKKGKKPKKQKWTEKYHQEKEVKK